MGELTYQIGYGESVTRWWITEMQKEEFISPFKTFDAPINEGEAYVQIVYPVREEFLKNNQIEKTQIYEGTYDRVYFPFENNRIDFSTFIHVPHHVWIYAQTKLKVKKAGRYSFEVYTCGGMKVWNNGKEVVCFAPYTRNIVHKMVIELELNEGDNEILVYADELAERDVFFYYEMRYKGQEPLYGGIEIDDNPEDIIDIEQFLTSCYFEKDMLTTGNVYLNYDNKLLKRDKKIYIEGDAHAAKLSNVEIGNALVVTASKYQDKVDLGSIKDYNVGAFKILVSCETEKFKITRDLVLAINPDDYIKMKPAPDMKGRKKQALNFICEHGENVIARTMAILEIEHKFNKIAHDCMDNCIRRIEKKEDCADFVLAPMFILITRYRQYLSDAQYLRIKSAILNFRYWIDEPGNDVMWYFSENHALLFHIAQYLGGNFFPEEVFTASGKTGSEQYVTGKKRVMDWMNNFFAYGYAEWNSATYIPIDLIGFFVLYDMAPDEEIREQAKRALEFSFKVIAYNSFEGIMCSSYGRAYEDTLKSRIQIGPNFFHWVASGKGHVSASASGIVALFCLSEYEPSDFDQDIMIKEDEWLSVELDQGVNKVKTFYYKTNDYFMACVRRFKPFVHGHQQHLMNIALGKDSIQYFINHPGERLFSGENRPCYWAGNGTMPYVEQYQNAMIMLYKIDPEEQVHYIHAYTPLYLYDEYEFNQKWFFIRVGDSYVATWFSNGVRLTEYGANTGKEIVSDGLNHAVIIKCGSARENGSFALFKKSMKETESSIEYDGNDKLSFNDISYGRFEVDGTDKVTVGGTLLEYSPKPEMEVRRGRIE